LLHPRDGFLVIFKDGTEPTKELSTEEKKYLREKENNLRELRSSFSYKLSRERSLKIKQQDVDIELDDNDYDIDINTETHDD